MKTPTGTRFVIAAIIITLGCLGLLAHVRSAGVCFSPACLFLMGFAVLTRPIPRNEARWTIIGIAVFLVVMLTLPFLHTHTHSTDEAALRIMGYPALVVPLWLVLLWLVYRAWQREKLGESLTVNPPQSKVEL